MLWLVHWTSQSLVWSQTEPGLLKKVVESWAVVRRLSGTCGPLDAFSVFVHNHQPALGRKFTSHQKTSGIWRNYWKVLHQIFLIIYSPVNASSSLVTSLGTNYNCFWRGGCELRPHKSTWCMLVAAAGTPCWLIWCEDRISCCDWPEEHCSVRHNPVLSSYFSACSQDFIRWEINIEKTHDKPSSGVQALGPLAILWNSHAACPAKIVPVKKGKFYLYSQWQYTGSQGILLVTAVCHKPFLWKMLAPQRCGFWLQGNY